MYPHDDESVLSGIYTESGDVSVAHNTVLDAEDDDELFRRAVQAEQGRVMREFGVMPPVNYTSRDDVISTVEDTASESSEVKDKTTSTPETYDEVYGVDDEESDGNDDESTFHPNTLFPSTGEAEMKLPIHNPILTPRRLKIIMVALCAIFVASIAVAMGSFLAQKEVESPTPVQVDPDASANADINTDTDVEVPDMEQLSTTGPVSSPSSSPTVMLHWMEGECTDHPTKKFQINEEIGEQDCSFLRSNLDQRARLCLSEREGYRWCPVTCGLCLKNLAPSLSPTPARVNTPADPQVDTPSEETSSPTLTPTTISPTPNPTVAATEEPTPVPTAELTVAPTVAPTATPTLELTTIATAAPSTETSSSYFCRTCPFKICEFLTCN